VKKDIDAALENLANYFKNNPYSTIKIADLLVAVDNFLPEDKKLAKIGITPDLVGSLKTFLIGGAPGILDRSEYSKMAAIGFTLSRNLKPVLESLPKDFKMGINSTTFAIMEAGIQGLIDGKDYTFSNAALKQLLFTQLKNRG
jgi:hypothetical protein